MGKCLKVSRTLKVRGGIISQANRYLGGFCSSQSIFPPQIIQVLLTVLSRVARCHARPAPPQARSPPGLLHPAGQRACHTRRCGSGRQNSPADSPWTRRSDPTPVSCSGRCGCSCHQDHSGSAARARSSQSATAGQVFAP